MNHGIPIVALHPEHQLIARDARVVDQHVDASMRASTPATTLRMRHRVGHIQRNRLGPPAGGDDFPATDSAAFSPRAAATTTAPSAASRWAMARPIPRDAPVTSATRPSSRPITTRLLQHSAAGGATEALPHAPTASAAPPSARTPWPRPIAQPSPRPMPRPAPTTGHGR